MDTRRFSFSKGLILLGLAIFGSTNSFSAYYLAKSGISSPSFYAGLMSFGEFLCIFIYPFRKRKTVIKDVDAINNSRSIIFEKTLIEKLGKYSSCIIGVLDYFSTMLIFYSIKHLWIEIVVSLMMISIFYLFFYHKYILRKKLYRHQALGIIIFTIGIIIITMMMSMSSSRKVGDVNMIIYVVLMIISELFVAILLLTLEKIIWTINTTAEEINVIQGLTGMILSAVFYIPLSIMIEGEFSFDSMADPFLKEKSWWIVTLTLFYILSMFTYNYLLIKAIKISDSLAVCIMNSGRVMIINVFFFIVNPQSDYSEYVQIVFSFIIIIGLLIYNEVIILPFFGFKKSAHLSIKENQQFREQRDKKRDWMNNLDKLLYHNDSNQ